MVLILEGVSWDIRVRLLAEADNFDISTIGEAGNGMSPGTMIMGSTSYLRDLVSHHYVSPMPSTKDSDLRFSVTKTIARFQSL